MEKRVAVFIVAYNAEKYIGEVISRIPSYIARNLIEIFIIDDSSEDNTFDSAKKIPWSQEYAPIRVFKTPFNQGYGGNQKLGYRYAIKNKFDVVILLHGDGQYAPESLPEIIAPYDDDNVDAVFGSRFIIKGGARKGGMPFYKWIGNKILTGIQNFVLKTAMSEMHSGYRSYKVSSLKQIPFEYNADNFHFDADIIIQFVDAKFKIIEVEIPTYYGNEICRVNGMLYAWNCIRSLIKYKLMQFEIFYDPKFDIRRSSSIYTVKKSKTSLHYYVRNYFTKKKQRILDIGGGDGESISIYLAKDHEVTCVDSIGNNSTKEFTKITLDLDDEWYNLKNKYFDTVLALDIIEHLKNPEGTIVKIKEKLKPKGTLIASTGNVAFIMIRFMLLLGVFNYGRRGILDLTHTRLMTRKSFRRLLEQNGFKVERIIAFGIPFLDLKPGNFLFKFLERFSYCLAKIWPGLFAFQNLAICTKEKDIENLVEITFS